MLSESEIENFYRQTGVGSMNSDCTDVFQYFNDSKTELVYESIFEHYVRNGALKFMASGFREADELPLIEKALEDATDKYLTYQSYLEREPGILRYSMSKVNSDSDLFMLIEASIDVLWASYLPKEGTLTPRAESFTRWLADEISKNPSLREEFLSRGWKVVDGLLAESATTAETRAATQARLVRFQQERTTHALPLEK